MVTDAQVALLFFRCVTIMGRLVAWKNCDTINENFKFFPRAHIWTKLTRKLVALLREWSVCLQALKPNSNPLKMKEIYISWLPSQATVTLTVGFVAWKRGNHLIWRVAPLQLVTVYDHILTLKSEVRYIWTTGDTRASARYIFVRYFALCANGAMLVLSFVDFSPKVWPYPEDEIIILNFPSDVRAYHSLWSPQHLKGRQLRNTDHLQWSALCNPGVNHWEWAPFLLSLSSFL